MRPGFIFTWTSDIDLMHDQVQISGYNRLLPWVLPAIAFIAVHAYLYNELGLKVVNDSARYLEYAALLKSEGLFVQYHNFWYFGYVAFVFLTQCIHESIHSIVLFQILAFLLGCIALYKASCLIFRDKITALATVCVYIGWFKIASWNFYVLPESLYTSMICISLFTVSRFIALKKGLWLMILTVAVTFITKPTGIAVLIGLVSLFLYRAVKVWKPSFLTFIVWTVPIAAGGLLLLNRMLESFILVENYLTGEIVYGVSTVPTLQHQNLLVTNVPNELYIPSKTMRPVARLTLFVFYNPGFFFKLMMLKIAFLLAHIKPYYSTAHNVLIAVTLYPLYGMAICTIVLRKFIPEMLVFSIAMITSYVLIIGFTTEDWDGRFLMPLMPVLILFAAPSLKLSWKRWVSISTKSVK